MVLGRTPSAIARYLEYIAERRQRDRVSYENLFDQDGWKPASDKEARGQRLSFLSKS